MVTIGIDPAMREYGTAVCIIDEDKTARFLIFKTPYRFILWAQSDEAPRSAVIGIEHSSSDKIVYDYLRKGSTPAQRAKAVAVGKNMGVSSVMVECCQQVWGKGQVFDMSPTEKGAKIENPAVFLAYVRGNGHALTSYKGNKNEQDKRDAYCLAVKAAKWAKFGRPRRPAPKTPAAKRASKVKPKLK